MQVLEQKTIFLIVGMPLFLVSTKNRNKSDVARLRDQAYSALDRRAREEAWSKRSAFFIWSRAMWVLVREYGVPPSFMIVQRQKK